FVEGRQLVVVKGAGSQCQSCRLFHHRGQDSWVAVTLVDSRIGGEAIEITVALGIPHPDALAARQNDAERLVVLGAKARFPRDEIISCWVHHSSPAAAGRLASAQSSTPERTGLGFRP